MTVDEAIAQADGWQARDSHKVLAQEVEGLRAMMIPLVFSCVDSDEWNEAMDAIGYYVTDELKIKEPKP